MYKVIMRFHLLDVRLDMDNVLINEILRVRIMCTCIGTYSQR